MKENDREDNQMKKQVAMILAAAMIFGSLTGCGGSGSAQTTTAAPTEASKEAKGENTAAAAGNWEPSGSITFIAAAAAGGGYDTSARNFSKVMTETGLVKQSIKVVNDSGGAGQVGFTNFVNNYDGGDNALIAASTSSISIPLANEWEVTYRDFTPIAKLVNDAFTIVCTADNTELDTLDKITAKLKENPGSIKIGAAAPPDTDYIGLVLFLNQIGVDISNIEYVCYEGGGEQLPALLGGHIDLAVSTVSEFMAPAEAGQVKPVAVASAERIGGAFSDTPTFVESGVDLTFGNWRGFWGPKDMPAEAVAYWRNVAKQMVETDEWKEICANMQWVSEPVIDDCEQWTADYEADITKALEDAGII